MLQLEAVVRRIKWLLQKDPSAKVLVFSSWQDVLELVSHALQTNSLPFAYAKGRHAFDHAVSRFKQPLHPASPAQQGQAADLQILLLLIKQGANGLNLTGPAPSSQVKLLLCQFQCQSVSTMHLQCVCLPRLATASTPSTSVLHELHPTSV